MADQVSVANWPDSGSPERVAFELWRSLSGVVARDGTAQEKVRNALELYAQCLNATSYRRVDTSEIK